MKHLVVFGIAGIAALTFIGGLIGQAYKNYQSGVVEGVCSTYYTEKMNPGTDTSFVSIVGNYDSGNDGRGTCDIYSKDG